MKLRLALAALAAGLVAIPVATADADFSDGSGDAGGAPDVVDVSVFNDAFSRIVFAVRIAGGKAMAADGEIAFVIDSDRDDGTGSSGWDHLVLLSGEKRWKLLAWDGAKWADAPATTAKAYFLDDVVLFGVDRGELGNTAGFDFFVESTQYAGEEAIASDVAPEGDETWSYSTVRKTFGLGASRMVGVTKGGARAGKAFVAGYVYGRVDSPEPASGAKATCVATVAGKRVAAKVSISAEAAACRVTLPKTAKGKVLKLTLTTTLNGKSVRKGYATKVKA